MRRVALVLALMLIPGIAFAGGGGVDTSGCAGYAEGTTVSMLDSCFSGTTHFAPADTPVTVNNDGDLEHTLTAVNGSFDTGRVAPGGSAQLTFDESGIYRVFCTLHGTAAGEGMAGVVVVGEAIPAAVMTPMDTSAIREAVAEENAAIVDAIESWQSSIRSLTSTQAKVLVALDQDRANQGAGEGEIVADPGAQPALVAAETGVDPGRTLVLVLVGLAAGLALAALLTAFRLGMGRDERWTRLTPRIES